MGVGPAPVSASVMLGSRKPLNRSHIPGTLDAAPPGIDCSAQASCSGAAICATRPALAPALNLLGARDCTNACSHPPRLMAPSGRLHSGHDAVCTRQVILDLTPACRAREPKGRVGRQTMRLMIDGSIYAPLGGNPSELSGESL